MHIMVRSLNFNYQILQILTAVIAVQSLINWSAKRKDGAIILADFRGSTLHL